jgi:hypothetical protein
LQPSELDVHSERIDVLRASWNTTLLASCRSIAELPEVPLSSNRSDSIKVLPSWATELLNKEQACSVVAGLLRAEAAHSHFEQQASTIAASSSSVFRNQLQQLLMHAGYSVHAQACSVGNGPMMGREVQWRLKISNSQGSFTTTTLNDNNSRLCTPTLSCSHDVRRVKYGGRVWCVTVEHADHLVVSQRVESDGCGSVTESRPVVIGQTNQFHSNTLSDLAIRYNDQSILENMHVSEAFHLILRNADCDIFQSLTTEQRRECRETIVQMVLATDMKHHIGMLSDLQGAVESKKASGKWFDVNSRADRLMLLKNSLHLSDVANPTKTTASCARWADCIVSEWYSQGDLERSMGIDISPMMDRFASQKEKSQIGFLVSHALTIAHPQMPTFACRNLQLSL